MVKKILIAYSAGTFGAVCNFLFGVVLSQTGAFQLLNINLPSPAMPNALYQRLVWGGIWGALLLFPVPKTKIIMHGFILGIAPTLIAGLVFFPARGLGYFGINAGMLMPLVMVCFNWIWGSTMILVYQRA